MSDLVVVAIPCYNEAVTIAKVIRDFRKVLPDARICVFDNNSTDGSAAIAAALGVEVIRVYRQGKGYVMREIFMRIKCAALVVVDGDDTYFAEEVLLLLAPVLKGDADMVVGDRLKKADPQSLKQLNRFGNYLIVGLINRIFGAVYEDILSGYRVFSREFVASVPLLCPGFETETEITLQALEGEMRVVEIPVSYRNRPENSASKLRPFRDGLRIMITAGMLLRDHHPLRLYGFIGGICFLVASGAAFLKFWGYAVDVTVSQTVTAGLILLFAPLGMIALGIGLTLSAVNTRFREVRQIMRRDHAER